MPDTLALECGHSVAQPSGNGGTGYGPDASGARHCYACCTAEDVEALRTAVAFVAYVNLKARTLTNWPGSPLMTVTESRRVSGGGFHFGPLLYVRARDVHGGQWYGKGAGDGMAIRMRRTKASR